MKGTRFTCKKCGKRLKTLNFKTDICFYCNPEEYLSYFRKILEKAK